MSHESSADAGTTTVTYDDQTSRGFVWATVGWGIAGMLVGVWLALMMVWPPANLGEWFTFGRMRPVHTSVVIFAFAGNAIFAAVYYSTQRLLNTRMYSDAMSWFHLIGWQLIIAATGVSYVLGYTQTHEYAEMIWPIDIAITVVWVVFAANFFLTINERREEHIYVAIWFYIASIVTIALLHIFNNLVVPVNLVKSYPVFSGIQDAMIQWWYGHNAVAFVLTTPYLGLMYYFLPKAAERPVYSYRLSILHFWTLVFIYIWAGPHHLHYTSLPEWAATVGMVFSIMLWMPSWGGMLNGLLTLRGAWHKLRDSAVLKFFVVGVTFYGMATFEGPLLSVKAVNSLSHYTDWTIAHVHSGALGWNGFMTFGMIYWLLPRLWDTDLWSKRLAELHFWVGTLGILLYIVAMYSAGITQGLMWRAFNDTGQLMYPDFITTVERILPMYWVRVVGGTLYLAGMLMLGLNMVMTVLGGPDELPDETEEVPKPTWREADDEQDWSEVRRYDDALNRLSAKLEAGWHRLLEGWPLVFTILTTVAVLVGSVVEIIPTLLVDNRVSEVGTVEPYTPLELKGRDIYIKEGCVGCHSQMVRRMQSDVERYGAYNRPGEEIYERPFLWGSKRTGPDLAREGGKRTHRWHLRHMRDPDDMTKGSVMPPYPWLETNEMDLSELDDKLATLTMLGDPYSKQEINNAQEIARRQADKIASEIVDQGGPKDLDDKQIVALIAYLQSLGTEVERAPELEAADVGDDDGGGS
jgi:cytochrome c oxidase cbb3-type subunit I/II